jgi:hypothetical protein
MSPPPSRSSAATILDPPVRDDRVVRETSGKARAPGVPATQSAISSFKVFSATKARDRDVLGDRVTTWIAANPGVEVLRTVVSLSSDRGFHCLSLVLVCAERHSP